MPRVYLNPVERSVSERATGNSLSKVIINFYRIDGDDSKVMFLDFSVKNGTAVNGIDYHGPYIASGNDIVPLNSNRIQFSSGVNVVPVYFLLSNDDLNEGNETFDVKIQNAFILNDGSSIFTIVPGNDSATITIIDDYPPKINHSPYASVGTDQSAVEGDLFSYAIPADAITDSDGDLLTFSAKTQTGLDLPSWLKFDAATRILSGTPPNNTDDVYITIRATDPGGLYDQQNFTIKTISKNPLPIIGLTSSLGSSAKESAGIINFLVNRVGDSSNSSVVSYSTSDGTASAGSDYVTTSGNLTFLAGETSKTISVSIINDALVESDETFSLTLSNPTGATISPATVTATITNDDSVIGTTTSYSASPGGGWIWGTSASEMFQGADGADIFIMGDGDNSAYAGANNDFVIGGAGKDTIFGGIGGDWLYGGGGNDAISGDAGIDIVFGEVGNDSLYGGADTDYLLGGEGADLLIGDTGIDFLFGSEGDDTVSGGTEQDALYGGVGNDFLSGDAGDDFLEGDAGNDFLIGGAGNDVFFFNGSGEGVDFITDMGSGDVLVLAGYGFKDYAGVKAAMVQSGANTVLQTSSASAITFLNMKLTDLTANNFIV